MTHILGLGCNIHDRKRVLVFLPTGDRKCIGTSGIKHVERGSLSGFDVLERVTKGLLVFNADSAICNTPFWAVVCALPNPENPTISINSKCYRLASNVGPLNLLASDVLHNDTCVPERLNGLWLTRYSF